MSPIAVSVPAASIRATARALAKDLPRAENVWNCRRAELLRPHAAPRSTEQQLKRVLREGLVELPYVCTRSSPLRPENTSGGLAVPHAGFPRSVEKAGPSDPPCRTGARPACE